MLPFSVALLSAAALAYELLLMRLLAEEWWHPFAATVIGLALLGYGASGTALALLQRALLPRFHATFRFGALLFAVAAPAAYLLARAVSFNPLDLPWSPAQWCRFAAVYLVLSVPFLFAGGCIGLALRRFGTAIPGLYAADLAGAGAGAIGALALLYWATPEHALTAVALLACASALCARGPEEARRTLRPGRLAAVGVALLMGLLPARWLTPTPAEYKGLSRQLLVPGARIVEERSGPRARVSVLDPGSVPLRHAPGLSLGCDAEIPAQLGLFLDGEMADVLAAEPWAPAAYLDCLPLAAPYALLHRPRVAFLGTGAGTGMAVARRRGAVSVVAVEADAEVARVLAERLARASDPVVAVRHEEPRVFLAEPAAGFDLIQLQLAGGGGPPGMLSTVPDNLATVEALGAMLSRLNPQGMVAITTGLEVPPRAALRWFSIAVTALEGRGVTSPGPHLAWFRDWGTATLLVARNPLGPQRALALQDFCASRSYDLAYLWGVEAVAGDDRHHGLGEPWLAAAATAILGPGREDYLEAYPYSVAATTDDRPFFHRFFRWATLPGFWAARGRGGEGLLEWGYLLAPMTLVQAVVAGGVLILVPLAPLLRGRGPERKTLSPLPVGVYFGCIGVAFLMVEVVALNRAVRLLGQPLSAAAVLGGTLVFAGLGSRAAPRLWGRVPAPAAAACVAVAVFVAALNGAAVAGWGWAQGLALPARVAVVLATVAPAAFLMGAPFPLALARVSALAPRWVPWAWGVNGFGSVVSAALATVVAMHLGFAAALWLAAALYGAAAWASRGWSQGPCQ